MMLKRLRMDTWNRRTKKFLGSLPADFRTMGGVAISAMQERDCGALGREWGEAVLEGPFTYLAKLGWLDFGLNATAIIRSQCGEAGWQCRRHGL